MTKLKKLIFDQNFINKSAFLTQPPRRKSPNLVGKSKLFSNHGALFMAEEFAKYEIAQQALREGTYVEVDDERNTVAENWHILEHLFKLPVMPASDGSGAASYITEDDKDLLAEADEISYSLDLLGVCHTLHDIDNIYKVILHSIDRELVKSSQIKAVLDAKVDSRAAGYLLTPKQFKIVRSLCIDSSIWRDHHDEEANKSNLWEVLWQAQNDLNTVGTLSDESRRKLEAALASRKGTKRQRLYGPAAYVLLLAEFYEEHHHEGRKATLHADRTQISKRQHLHDEISKNDGKVAPWVRHYPSHFGIFLNAVMGHQRLEHIGKANVEKWLKNRKMLGNKKLTRFVRRGAKADFVEMIEAIDLIKP